MAQARLDIYPDRCLKLRHRKSGCRICQDACPYGAISFGDSLDVDYSRCCGCGICVNVCPTEVFASGECHHQQLLARVARKDEVEFDCSRWSSGADTVVPCLGYLNEGLLMSIIARGARLVSLNITPCQTCELKTGFTTLRHSSAMANSILALFGRGETVRLTTIQPNGVYRRQDNHRYSRRELFTYLTRGMRKTIERTRTDSGFTPEGLNRARVTLKPRLPEKRDLLLQSLKALGKPVFSRTETEGLPFLQLETTPECNGCGLCVTFCPSGALRQYDGDGRRIIEFSPAFCLACNLCIETCPRGALAKLAHLNIRDLQSGEYHVLVAHAQTKCSQCGRMIISNTASGLCPQCQKSGDIRGWLTTSCRARPGEPE